MPRKLVRNPKRVPVHKRAGVVQRHKVERTLIGQAGKTFPVVEAASDEEGVVIADFEFCPGIMKEKLWGIPVIAQRGHIARCQVVEPEVGQDQKAGRNLRKGQKTGAAGQVGQLQVGIFYCQIIGNGPVLMPDDKPDIFVATFIKPKRKWLVGMIDVILNNLCLHTYCQQQQGKGQEFGKKFHTNWYLIC